jgi:hypothetical protein
MVQQPHPQLRQRHRPSPTLPLGIQEAAQKGVVGRAVLLDWAGWAANTSLKYDAFQDRGIPPHELDLVAKWQGLPTSWSKPGDILIIRTCWVQKYNTLNLTEQSTLPYDANLESIGMEASDRSLKCLWEKK